MQPSGPPIALNPRGATIAFGFCFYLNLPIVLMDRAGLPGAVAGMFVFAGAVSLLNAWLVFLYLSRRF